jgi:hypothetical protein
MHRRHGNLLVTWDDSCTPGDPALSATARVLGRSGKRAIRRSRHLRSGPSKPCWRAAADREMHRRHGYLLVTDEASCTPGGPAYIATARNLGRSGIRAIRHSRGVRSRLCGRCRRRLLTARCIAGTVACWRHTRLRPRRKALYEVPRTEISAALARGQPAVPEASAAGLPGLAGGRRAIARCIAGTLSCW